MRQSRCPLSAANGGRLTENKKKILERVVKAITFLKRSDLSIREQLQFKSFDKR
jgi:hypothetical protein